MFAILARYCLTTNLLVEDLDHWKTEDGHYYLFQYDGYTYYEHYLEGKHDNLMTESMFLMCYLFDCSTEGKTMGIISFLPLIFTSLTVILVWHLIERFVNDRRVIFIMTLFFSVNFQFMMNSYYGHVDTNSLIHLLLSYIMLCVIILIERCGIKRYSSKNIMLMIFVIGSIWLLKYTWSGWFAIIVMIGVVMMTYYALNRRFKEFMLAFPLTVWFASKHMNLILSYLTKTREWNISETRMTNFGIYWILIIFLAGLSLYILYMKRHDLKHVLLNIWCLGTIYAAIMGYRFTFYMVIPCSILFAIFIENNRRYYTIVKNILPIYIVFVLFTAMTAFHLPAVDDDLYETSQFLKNGIESHKRIFSQWNYGVLYDSLSGKEAIYRSVQPYPDIDKILAKAFLDIDEDMLYHLVPDDAVFVVSSTDLTINQSVKIDDEFGLMKDSSIKKILDCRADMFDCVYTKKGRFKNFTVAVKI